MARGSWLCYASDHHRDSDLAGAITSLRATHVCLTPTLLAQLLPTDVPSLRYVPVGGESLNKADVVTWAGRVSLNHIYGTTESTIWCTLNNDLHQQSDPTNIGRSFGCITWITSPTDHDQLVPVSAIGELLIEGPILARGYLNEEATQKSFIRDPRWLKTFRTDENARFYKIGDLVRYGTDGSIQFIGRKDTQVKLQ
ncbi:uncharacterized protein B0J16DRAFT_379579 [Fusarium flagelliforme]|nr:uncharacterized protein B0J16DRAFT_325768 [Fusarium flagelliforme]XP_045990773.1 uncharacterized protein B0J16DRAFT_379579 [Fusarium flagelliforme]KAH7169634.1 hypothetical protein B0J16DRAFT_325768 [Fusarium flagelliforme]KAH7199137.1 hypothetical protein B0J16DRAFT_379579 [Fusarium flagelliforme]